MSQIFTATAPEWIDPDEIPAPRGTTLQILTIEGVTIRGEWADDQGFVGYAPLLKIPAQIKAKMGIYELNKYYVSRQTKHEERWTNVRMP